MKKPPPASRYFVVWGLSSVWLVKAKDAAGATAKIDNKDNRSRGAHLRAREATPEDVRQLQEANGTKVPAGAEKWAAES